jgi:hypothetical protein
MSVSEPYRRLTILPFQSLVHVANMSNTSTQDYTWPPVYDVLELTNCDELAHIWNWYQQPGGLQQASLSDEVIQYIYHGLTGYLENSSQKGLSQPPHNEVLEWIRTSAVENYVTMLAIGDPYYKNNDGQYIGEMKFMPECWLEVCRVLPWDGNPDIAGVGVRHTVNGLSLTIPLTITDARNIHTPDVSRYGLSLCTHDNTLRLDANQDAQFLSN